ncbi:MAG: MMPL family transporter [Anaerolineaceae bacterium]|nr:MMPL family transporter [Anaerolineaceae bacterium]
MKKFIQNSWIAIIVWVVIVSAAFFTMPDLARLVREKGQAKIGPEYSYSIGKNIKAKMDSNGAPVENEIELALLYKNPSKLTEADKANIEKKLSFLEENKVKFHLLTILNALENKDLQDTLISSDGTTLLVPVYIDKDNNSSQAIRDGLNQVMPVEGVEFYTTGSEFVIEDFIQTTEAGVAKTEVITVIFIFAILLVIFMSPITPLVVLATVGLSFLVSLNVVLQLVTYANFPLSNFTKVFLILILFGIGTDYSLLLFMRFKEELASGAEKVQAILTSYKTAGKTILISSSTILVGFASLFFVNFETYRSAAAVAIGVFILILVLLTLIPAVMYLFGPFLFWSPFKNKGRSESKTWKRISSFSVKYPWLAILFTLLLCSLVFLYNKNLSFNNLQEVDPGYPSIIGNKIATEEFSHGLTMPLTIAIDNPQRLDTQEYLADIDKLTRILQSIDGVKEVHSVTQPKGETFKELYLQDQSQTLNTGLDDALSGLDEINSGLDEAINKISNSSYDENSISDLKTGTNNLVSAISELTDGGQSLLSGVNSADSGSEELVSGLKSLRSNLEKLQTSVNGLQIYYSQLASGYASIDQNLGNLNSSLAGIKTGLVGISSMQTAMAAYPYDVNHDGTIDPGETLAGDALFQQMAGTTAALNSGLGDITAGYGQVEGGLASANLKLVSVNQGLCQAQTGIAQLIAGTDQILEGGNDLQSGLNDIQAGQVKLVTAMRSIESGSKELRNGQTKLIDGVSSIKSQMNELEIGLQDANQGVSDISNGLVDATSYLQGLEDSGISKNTFYIPQKEINGDLFPRSMKIFFSEDRTITKMIVILDVDPYTREGMNVANKVDQIFSAAIQTTQLKDAKWGMTGVTQMNLDLETMSNEAFVFARLVMIAAIFIVILIITRDFWMTLFVSISLFASYFIAISLSGVFFKYVLGLAQLSWNVPFFSFIMIVSLGVDYSIFLIMRQKENSALSMTDSLIEAAAKVGSVIVSAGLILSGTFAAMYPSGVFTLMEISVTVIIGIMLLVLAFIPVFIPAMTSLKSKIFKG